MKRRQFIKTTSASLTGFALSAQIASAAQAQARPNILIIMTDQQPSSAMSCAGSNELSTPAMDSIAENGVRFDNAYCAYPLCAPSRISMLSGRMPHVFSMVCNQGKFPSGIPIYGKLLADAGYDCGYVGKWHAVMRESAVDKHGFSWTQNMENNRIDSKLPASCKEFFTMSRNKPFLLVASFVNPHDICQWARGDGLPNGSIGTPPAPEQCPELPVNFEPPDIEPSVIRAFQPTLPNAYPSINWSKDKWRQYRWAMGRITEKVDNLIGQVLKSLRDSSLEENTVILFLSDHGDGYASHRWNQKNVLYEESVGVPLIISQKGVTSKHVDTTNIVHTGLDLMPTVCDYAGVSIPANLKGKSLRPLVERKADSLDREFIVTETQLCDEPIWGRMVRTKKYKYIIYSEGDHREQLFDMETDRGEMKNLAEKSSYSAILNQHRTMLSTWCKETADTFAQYLPAITHASEQDKRAPTNLSRMRITRTASRELVIYTDSNEKGTIDLLTHDGRSLMRQSVRSARHIRLATGHLAHGSYTVRLRTGGRDLISAVAL